MKRPEIIKLGEDLQINIDPKIVIVAVVVIVLGAWFALGGPIYTIAADEVGVVLTLGKYTATTGPGLHTKLPWPIQTVEKPKVTKVNRLEFGFRSYTYGGETTYRDFGDDPDLLHEAQMLTGDENVVNCSMAVQYRIADPFKYLFNFRNSAEVDAVLRDIGEAALRQVIGDRPIDHALTTGKEEIRTEVRRKMKELVDLYQVGVTITAVQLQDVKPPKAVEGAFKDVATAREERERLINEADGYQNEQIPRAEGVAQSAIVKAQGYKAARIAEARGQVARFKAIAREYEAAPEITRARLYLETMAELFQKMKVTVIDRETNLVNLKALGGALPFGMPQLAPRASSTPVKPTLRSQR